MNRATCFSYPWNKNQLEQQIAAGINLLTGPQQFYTDDSSQTQRLQWSSGSGQDQTAGSTNTHSYEKAYSLTGGKAIGKILDVNLQGNLDYNSSSSIGTLNKSSSSVGASQGIAIAKPGTFQNSNLYQYRIEPYIFGRTPPAGIGGCGDAAARYPDIGTAASCLRRQSAGCSGWFLVGVRCKPLYAAYRRSPKPSGALEQE